MRKTPLIQWTLAGGIALFGFSFLNAQTPAPSPARSSEANILYHQALAAYLGGKYDQAILLTAKSLEKDPNDKNSKNLLEKLTVEKDRSRKTVIWIGGKAPKSTVPALNSGDSARMSAGEENDFRTQLGKLQGRLDEMKQKMELTGSKGSMRLIPLYVLCVISLIVSFLSFTGKTRTNGNMKALIKKRSRY